MKPSLAQFGGVDGIEQHLIQAEALAGPRPVFPMVRALIAEVRRHQALTEAVRGLLEDTEDESKDIDFLWDAWNQFNAAGG